MNPSLFISFILNLIPGEFETLNYNVHQSGQDCDMQGNTGVIYVGQKDPGRGLRRSYDVCDLGTAPLWPPPVLSSSLNNGPRRRFHP